jgi:hypothetical protein
MSQVTNAKLAETALTGAERELWNQLKQKVKVGLDAFFEAGIALWEIHENRLYRDEFPSWEAYSNQVLGRNRTASLRWIQSAKIVEELSPTGDILPANEAQARELIPLKSAELRREAWARAVEISHCKNQAPTARVVRSIVKELTAEEPPDIVDEPIDDESTAEALKTDGGKGEPDGEELEPIRLADGSEVSDEDWADGVFDRRLMQARVDELSEGVDLDSVPRQRLLVGIVSLMNRYLDQRPGKGGYQDLKAVSSSINKVLLVGAKPGYVEEL